MKKSYRPRLEVLESRELLANDWWCPPQGTLLVNRQWQVANNWIDLATQQRAAVPPGINDAAYFDSSQGAGPWNYECWLSADVAVDRFELRNGYTGRLEVGPRSLSTLHGGMDCGQITMDDGSLTVKDFWQFNGGSLVKDPTALQSVAGRVKVTSGGTLSVSGPVHTFQAVVTVGDATNTGHFVLNSGGGLTCKDGTSFTINADSSLEFRGDRSLGDAGLFWENNAAQAAVVTNHGTVYRYGAGLVTCDYPVVNDGSVIVSNAPALFGGKVGLSLPHKNAASDNYSLKQTGGLTQIGDLLNGRAASLETTFGVKLSGGNLSTWDVGGILTGGLTVSGGSVNVCMGDTTHTGTFSVTGDVSFSGGILYVTCVGNTAPGGSSCSKLSVSGNLTFTQGNGCSLSVGLRPNTGTIPANTTWTLAEALGGGSLTGQPVFTDLPTGFTLDVGATSLGTHN